MVRTYNEKNIRRKKITYQTPLGLKSKGRLRGWWKELEENIKIIQKLEKWKT